MQQCPGQDNVYSSPGLASSEEHFRVFYAERNVWWLEVTCHGNPGHGSAFLANTAAEKLRRVINRFLEHRQQQQQRLASDPSLSAGDVTSINLTIMKGGVQYNVVPESFSAGFDIRIPPTESLEDFDKMLEEWRIEAGSDVTYTYHHKTNSTSEHITPTDDSNPWWIKFSRACQSTGITIRKEIFPAGTDGRQLRLLGLPVLGFSPINNTPILLHDHNEYLNEAVFLRGVSIYKQILRELGSP
uniref:N-acyl-aliphatic-L-amino acid amidohydrolase n=1 Tax=Biomphalaria glabrata TaxID=6526 RepID=A0A2C9KUS4_BIOGL